MQQSLAPLSSTSTLANPRLQLVGMHYMSLLWHDPRPSIGCTLLVHTEQLRLPCLCQAVSPIGPLNQPRPVYILELQIHLRSLDETRIFLFQILLDRALSFIRP